MALCHTKGIEHRGVFVLFKKGDLNGPPDYLNRNVTLSELICNLRSSTMTAENFPLTHWRDLLFTALIVIVFIFALAVVGVAFTNRWTMYRCQNSHSRLSGRSQLSRDLEAQHIELSQPRNLEYSVITPGRSKEGGDIAAYVERGCEWTGLPTYEQSQRSKLLGVGQI